MQQLAWARCVYGFHVLGALEEVHDALGEAPRGGHAPALAQAFPASGGHQINEVRGVGGAEPHAPGLGPELSPD
eukprot:14119673-Alexandrium_andersonii.AAC.1